MNGWTDDDMRLSTGRRRRWIALGGATGAGLVLAIAALAQEVQGTAVIPPKRITVNATELAYVEQGQGEPIMLVLGGVGDYRLWMPQIATLAGGYRVIAYSFRHHFPNAPAGGRPEYTVLGHTADLAALLRGLQAGPAHLVGYSYGGSVSAVLARDHPELVRSLTLADPPLYALIDQHPEAKPLMEERGRAMDRVQAALKVGRDREAIDTFLDFVFAPGDHRVLSPPDLAIMRANAGVLRLLLGGAPVPFTCQDAGRIRAPTLLMTGEHSRPLFTLTLDELARCLPTSERVTLPGTTHALPLENPVAFNDAVLRFLGRR